MRKSVVGILMATVLLASILAVDSAAARGTKEVFLSLAAQPTLANVGEAIQISGETDPKLDGTLTLIPYTGIGMPEEIRGIPVEGGIISFSWTPTEAGKYMLVIIFVPKDSVYATAIGVIKDIIVKDIRLTLSLKEIFYHPGQRVKIYLSATRVDGTPIPWAPVTLNFAGNIVKTLTGSDGKLKTELVIPPGVLGELTIEASSPPAHAIAKIYVGLLDRISQIREVDYKYTVPANFVTPEEYAEQYRSWMEEVPKEEWEFAQQEYEALYLLEEGMDVKDVSEKFWTGAVLAYYDSAEDSITIVTREGWIGATEEIIVHELVHALTDQHFPDVYEYESKLTDESFAISALIEGDANMVKEIYIKKYLTVKSQGTENNLEQVPIGFQLIHYFPYIEGPNFIRALREKGGWEAVNQAYVALPKSTEQIIHPEKYGIDDPTKVTVEDRSTEEWVILGRDTLGEFAIFVMFWNQGIISFGVKDGHYTYTSHVSEGWDGDELVVYKKGDKYGYVWQIVWDSEEDAKEFLDGYEWMLWVMGATLVNGVWKIDSNDYLKIKQEGKVITIVNGPSPEALAEIHGEM